MNVRAFVLLAIWSLAPGVSQGREVLKHVAWNALPDAPEGVSIESVSGSGHDGGRCLKVAKETSGKTTVPLLEVEAPGISLPMYAVKGRVRTEAVRGQAYLELLSHFGADGVHYSRTLSGSGPMQHLGGTSEWREFMLPFFSSPGHAPPSKLSVNLVLPGPGVVTIGPLELVQAPERAGLDGQPGQWWNTRQAGLFGGIGGTLVGLFGALIGLLAAKGQAPRFVLGLTAVAIVAGLAVLLLGVAAFVRGQPYAVYYPPLLLGGITTLVCGSSLLVVRRRYRNLELRKIQACDA